MAFAITSPPHTAREQGPARDHGRSSDATGVAADWLTSIRGQNAGIHQTSPAAAVAEEVVADWLLELLDLPRASSVGFVTGATMASFVGLAAARTQVLADAGHDFEAYGLQGAPRVQVFLSDDAHVANRSALRYLGFGAANVTEIPSDDRGLMEVCALAEALQAHVGPKIIIAQAGHINSGGFEDLPGIVASARKHGAWVHVDGAFGLWALLLPEKAALTAGLDEADSWSVDGHKWLQLPYDSGFAIIRHPDAHRRAMDMTAGYLNHGPEDGRNPTHFVPELSRRARGFAAWAVLRRWGRHGIAGMVRRHCAAAERLAARLERIGGLEVLNPVVLNQVLVGAGPGRDADAIVELADALNASGVFVRTAQWKGRGVLRFSVISSDVGPDDADRVADVIEEVWPRRAGRATRGHEERSLGAQA
ncbi:MAG: aminotransferase class V-fold PLP-dependent enzyme [Myxococcota bacterium]